MKIKLSELIAPTFYQVHNCVSQNKYTYYWLKGGRGSGKSSFVSLEIILGLLLDKNAHAVCFRRYANTLNTSIVPQLEWAISMLGMEKYFKTNLTKGEIVYIKTGQKILLRGLYGGEKTKGLKPDFGSFSYIWFEELTEFAGLDQIETATRSLLRGVEGGKVFCTYNPDKSGLNWVNAEAMLIREDRLVHSSTYLDLPKAWLGTQFIKEAKWVKEHNPVKYAWAYLGEITGYGGEVFTNLKIRKISSEERQAIDKLSCGVDFGYSIDPSAVVLCGYVKGLEKLYIFNEFYARGASYARLYEEISKILPNGVKITADSAEPRSIAHLKEMGLPIYPAKKGQGSVDYGIKWLQDLDEIIIDENCINVAREFSSYEYARDKQGNFIANFPDRDNHSIDAVRYAVEQWNVKNGVKVLK